MKPLILALVLIGALAESALAASTPGARRVQEIVRKSGANARATTPQKAAQACNLLLFAVPWEAAESSLRSLGPLTGKIIMDANNPLDIRDGREIELPVTDSAAERLQAWAPGAVIVKDREAFNTMNRAVMEDPRIADGPVSVPTSQVTTWLRRPRWQSW